MQVRGVLSTHYQLARGTVVGYVAAGDFSNITIWYGVEKNTGAKGVILFAWTQTGKLTD